MHSRDEFLEEALKNTIQAKDLQASIGLINTLQQNHNISLANLNKQSRKFLFLALKAGANEIASFFLNLHADNDEVLFGLDENRKTLLHMSVLLGNNCIVVKLLEIAVIKNKIKFYLEAEDKDGCTALHYAAMSAGSDTLVELLLTTMKENRQLVSWINRADKNGNSATHYAFEQGSCKSIKALIYYGAKLHFPNNLSVPSISQFSHYPIKKQLDIFFGINTEKKAYLLKLYRELLTNTLIKPKPPTDEALEELKNNYFQLASLQSLQALLIARHEFDDKIPIRNSYFDKIISNKADKNGKYLMAGKENFINNMDTVLNRMPLYTEKLMGKKKHIKGKEKEEIEDIDIMPEDEILNSDRVALTTLISHIEDYLGVLQGKPPRERSIICRILTLFLGGGLASCGIVCMLFAGFIVQISSYCRSSDGSPSLSGSSFNEWFCSLDTGLAAEISIITAVGFLGISCFMAFLQPRETRISRYEWQPLLDELQQELLQKLQELEKEGKKENKDYLPTSPTNVRNLETQIAHISCNKKPLSQVIDNFTQSKETVEAIREDLNLSKKPISLFFKPPVIIDIASSDSECDSEDELLPKHAYGR